MQVGNFRKHWFFRLERTALFVMTPLFYVWLARRDYDFTTRSVWRGWSYGTPNWQRHHRTTIEWL